MYIRKTTKKYKEKSYDNYLLVESYQTPKGPRQKTICSLGSLEPRPRDGWLQLARKVEAALLGQMFLQGPDPQVDEIVKKAKAYEEKRDTISTDKKEQEKQSVTDIVAVHTDQVTTENPR